MRGSQGGSAAADHPLKTRNRTGPTSSSSAAAARTNAPQTAPGCDSAGIILLVDGEPAVSDRLTVEIDLVQYDTGEGPCLEAIRHGEVIRIDLMAEDERFRRLAPGALAHDVNSVLSLPLTAHGDDVGALNLYSHEANAFDDGTDELVQHLADYAAEVIASSPLYAYSLDMIEGLIESMEAQALVSRATGVLMATEGRTTSKPWTGSATTPSPAASRCPRWPTGC